MSFLKYNILISPRYKVRRGLIFCSQSFYWQLAVKQTRVLISAFKENLPTEGISTQSQARAREIVNSREYQENTVALDEFLGKIHSEKFMSDDFFDTENKTYNRETIKRRLHYSSFESVDEFIAKYEQMLSSIEQLAKKYPYLAEDSSLLEDVNDLESLKEINNREIRTYCIGDCYDSNDRCFINARNTYRISMIVCGAVFIGGNWVGGGVCASSATANFVTASNRCEDGFDSCVARCRGW